MIKLPLKITIPNFSKNSENNYLIKQNNLAMVSISGIEFSLFIILIAIIVLGPNEPFHDVHGWKLHFHISYHDGWHDVCQANPCSVEHEYKYLFSDQNISQANY